ncbi:MAG: prolipoprotein diacylglyceryl transferase [Gammaproteobacteria bacterium]|nr:prolipoprotein diacylglyceryl transferase [Gammaproteobacteria bacterium]MDH3372160.1 prolipoprotein diacylglyceryl transferase [Gammaproteobacteria bacterium]MDH3409728.1 prolipoprotein diacylglyceryl transferase [Gammaproteobacteria bacterium]MDH3553174.1 prolipoprotein diacylglyceryl transferase [Gammaproteobacteria bacterium]
MIVYPEIDPIIFQIGFLKIRWYGLMYVIGFLFAWWLARRRCHVKHSPIKADQVDDLIFNAMLGVIVGGRIGSVVVYNWATFLEDPLYLFKIWEGGMSFHGGLVGVLVAMWLFARKRGLTMWQVTDFIGPLVPLGLGFGRIGNFINGELWGKPTEVAWGVLYKGQVLHPSQLYEAALEGFVLFAVLWWFSSRPRPYMAVSGLFLTLYGIFRFYIEFYRVPDAHIGYLLADWVTMGQILSAPMIIIGATMLAMAYRSRNKEAAA